MRVMRLTGKVVIRGISTRNELTAYIIKSVQVYTQTILICDILV